MVDTNSYNPKQFKESWSFARWLWICLAVSVVVHVAIIAWLFNSPIGNINPALLHSQRMVVHLKIANYRALHTPIPGAGVNGAGESKKQLPSASDLSKKLLAAKPAKTNDIFSKPKAAPEKEVRSKPVENLPDHSSHLPGGLFKSMANLPVSKLRGPEAEKPSAEDTSGFAFGGGNLQTAARQLLAGAGGTSGTAPGGFGSSDLTQAGLVAGGAGQSSSLPEKMNKRPSLGLDSRRLDITTKGSPIDFSKLALSGTEHLKIPKHLDHDFNYSVLRYKEPVSPGSAVKPGYFKVNISTKRSLGELQVMRKNMVFILDISGSIPRNWVRQVIRGVAQSLPSLNKGDQFNIVLFNGQARVFSPGGLAPANAQNLKAARSFLYNARSGGFTDIDSTLRRLLVPNVAGNRVYDLILISDGHPTRGVMDTRQLINLITKENSLEASIYCVGVGPDQNRKLLDFLAYRNRGFTRFIDDNNKTPQIIRALTSRLRYPLIKNVELSVVGVKLDSVFPLHLPDIHRGENFSVFGRFNSPGKFTMRITGINNGHQVDFTFTRDLAKAPKGSREMVYQWGFHKLHYLYSQMLRRGESSPDPHIQNQIRQLKQKYGLKTLY